MKEQTTPTLLTRRNIVIIFVIAVSLLHFVTGPGYRGPCPHFVNGYLIDLLLPCAMYLLLGVARQTLLTSASGRALLVFGIGAISETLQYAGVPLFGETFDPFDYVMFAVGIGLGILIENYILRRLPA